MRCGTSVLSQRRSQAGFDPQKDRPFVDPNLRLRTLGDLDRNLFIFLHVAEILRLQSLLGKELCEREELARPPSGIVEKLVKGDHGARLNTRTRQFEDRPGGRIQVTIDVQEGHRSGVGLQKRWQAFIEPPLNQLHVGPHRRERIHFEVALLDAGPPVLGQALERIEAKHLSFDPFGDKIHRRSAMNAELAVQTAGNAHRGKARRKQLKLVVKERCQPQVFFYKPAGILQRSALHGAMNVVRILIEGVVRNPVNHALEAAFNGGEQPSWYLSALRENNVPLCTAGLRHGPPRRA